jgi:hypothetical protein
MKDATLCQVCPLPSTLAELFAEVNQKGQLTLTDRYRLRAAILNNPLNQDEFDLINRLLYSVRRGLLKVGHEL